MSKMISGFALAALTVFTAPFALGCLGAAGEGDVDVGSDQVPDIVESTAEATQAITRSEIIDRALQWYYAQMPYCGGVNGGPDYICGGTCVRTGAAANPAWDPYRSDCSGYVSWAWGLSAPGLTTGTLPGVATAINVGDLQPGDALISGGHAVIFEFWIDQGARAGHVIHEGNCGQVATGVDVTLNGGGTQSYFWGDTYTAYRYNGTE